MGKDNLQAPTLYQANLRQALMAGALAGTAVDSVLFPLGRPIRTSVNCSIY